MGAWTLTGRWPSNMKILDTDARVLGELKLKQDRNALMLGALVWECHKKRLELGDSPDWTKLGALQYEYENRKKFMLDTIQRTEGEQHAAGIRALQNLNINPDAANFTITEGVVMILKDSAYVTFTMEGA